MKEQFDYRAYTIDNEQGRYVARATDGDDLSLASSYLIRVLRGIDAVWDALETIVDAAASSSHLPFWLREWLEKPINYVDLDAANDAAPLEEPGEVIAFPSKPKFSAVSNAVAGLSGLVLVGLQSLADVSTLVDFALT
jgi:hypothetical protein